MPLHTIELSAEDFLYWQVVYKYYYHPLNTNMHSRFSIMGGLDQEPCGVNLFRHEKYNDITTNVLTYNSKCL